VGNFYEGMHKVEKLNVEITSSWYNKIKRHRRQCTIGNFEKPEVYKVDTNELMTMVDSLPLDLKTQLIDHLLNSLNPSPKEIDELWAQEAEKRVAEIRSGKVNPIDGEEVFREIHKRFSK
jgi:putative addiction module component (TIGR02574 family)